MIIIQSRGTGWDTLSLPLSLSFLSPTTAALESATVR